MENNTFDPLNDNMSASTAPVGNDKIYAILSYIGILWLLGLLIAPEKEHAFTKNHVNNGIVLTICGVICGIIPVVGWIASVVVLVFAIMGLVKACQGELFTIPLIGDKFVIIK